MKPGSKQILLPAVVGIAALVFIGIMIVSREVISYFQMPICSERDPDPQGYTYIKNLNTVSMGEVNSNRLCTAIEGFDTNGKTQCSIDWIYEDASIARIHVSGVRDCHGSAKNYVFADWDYAKVIVRGRLISESDFREAVEHPRRAGKYLDGLNLTDEEIGMIYSFITTSDLSR
jgi:hypothetical protein